MKSHPAMGPRPWPGARLAVAREGVGGMSPRTGRGLPGAAGLPAGLHRRVWIPATCYVLLACLSRPLWGQTENPALKTPVPIPSSISLEIGEVRNLSVDGVTRVVVGKPEVVDISIISTNEILLQAKAAGSTSVILWDQQGQHVSNVEVIDRTPEATEAQLRQLLAGLNVPGVNVQRENGKVFLVGQVASQEEMDRLEQLLSSFKDVANLVSMPQGPEGLSAGELAPLVKLTVQVIGIASSDLERLGVDWSDSVTFTDQAFVVGPTGEFKPQTEGILDTGDSVVKRVGEAFRIGRVFRQGVGATINALMTKARARLLAEPKLVTTSGKEATSFIGFEVPVIKEVSNDGGAVTTSIEFRETGVVLKMTPTVHENDPDQKITINLEAEVSAVDKTAGLDVPVGTRTITIPGFQVRKTSTEVTSKSKETIFIAGLLESRDDVNVAQVPGLGSMPVIGRLFRSPETKSNQGEVIIAITPELLADEGLEGDRALAVEQSLALADVSASVDDPRLRYALQVQDRIAKALQYPQREKLQVEGKVKLKLHIFPDGSLDRVAISESSGVESIDAAAIQAAKTQSPYPMFPPQLSEREMWLELPVIFRPR